MEDRRNIILAVLLTGLILFGWPYVAEQFFPTPPAADKSVSAPAKSEGANSDSGDIAVTSLPAKAVALPSALAANPRVLIETPKLKGSINLEGARVDDLVLSTHRQELSKKSPPVRLFAPSGTENAYFARFGWTGNGATLPTDKTVWTPDGKKLTPTSPVTLSWTNPEGQRFDIKLSIDEHYMLSADQRFTNAVGLPTANVTPFGIISRKGKPKEATKGGSIFTQIHIGPIGVFNGEPNYDWGYDQVAEAPGNKVSFDSTGGWNGMTDKYWLAALIPDQKVPVKAEFRSEGGYNWANVRNAQLTAVAAGQSASQTSHLFAGAKEFEELRTYTKKLGIPYLDYSIDWGWFWFIAIPFLTILLWLFDLVGNFGVAIIALTIIVRIFMFPVAQKQFASMAGMRAVQPKMKVLQERYKDDKPKLQQEMMKLYQEEKINPLAGCLPILLQIPIFFALYKILMLTVEMRHQPFALWLKDLSAPDPLTPVNLFGLLPFDPPTFLAIGILPILLGITMWLMQKLNPQPMDEVQKQVFAIMPWFLMFIMAPFAAGLQLYWVVSNLISIGQQKWLYAKHPILKEQMAKEEAEKKKAKA
ncbi:membrane protein insertase YidC [Sphingorhabdus sp.]|uniref:membrane protein insertase YidC n=1 Tax=Sphingorhabdus sp. TaxID=1902408 RepID=UPI0032B841D2